ncbi:rhodanese-like domain-containing protein [Micrococcus sp.]|uniref:rhodanese-like domain-containing protein n=1 Tax=Micrococcus sp. TaxID=1271 RepID=UPI002A913E4E|nr:rhodanese-like domain-containing protein [Micrococcus sp.]MDY6054671.1 rhodanese-like domain-containing protein [Micrococcus sp.]
MSLFETVSVDQVPADAHILDVREDDEFVLGRAAGAQHIPLGQVPERYEDELDPDTDYYVICRTGGRSARAAEFLVARGYSAINVAGGSGAWLEAGKPMEADGGAEPTVK